MHEVARERSMITIEAVDRSVYSAVASNYIDDTVPTENDLIKVESLQGSWGITNQVESTLGYDDLAKSVQTNKIRYKNYLKEKKRIELERKKRLEELKRKAEERRLAEEKRKLEEQKNLEAELKKIKEQQKGVKKSRLRTISNEKSNLISKSTIFTDTFRVTGYCACKLCCGVWSPEVTGEVARTASGEIPVAGVTVAVDPDVIPLGSIVKINGHYYIAEDTGSAVKGNVIDIYFDRHEQALNWGAKNLEVKVFLKETK